MPDRQPEYEDRVAIGRVAKTQGRKGEVFARFLTDFPHRFEKLKTVHLKHPQGTHALLAVQGTWFHKNGVVLKFEGVDTISDAEAFIGCDILVEPFEVETLPSGTYYRHNLVGCAVLDEEERPIGTVESVEDHGANTLLVLRMQNGQEVLVPAARSFLVHIDEENRRITVRLPAELLELNR